ncbi:MAG: TerB family tellurite resistance protein [Bacteroidales bacterium]|nr:TerB family tellurite resistance protein [Bacteroidales bacterium]MBN2757354.1 TerB family tellurite resistance protein [Bacteroidales bacterium]
MSESTNNRNIKKEHFSNLVAVAYSDNVLNNEEKEFLQERANDYGLSQDEIHEITEQAETLKFIVPLNGEEKEEQLADIVYMSMIDGVVNEKEYEICLKIAERLDFKQKDLDYIIELTKKLWSH